MRMVIRNFAGYGARIAIIESRRSSSPPAYLGSCPQAGVPPVRIKKNFQPLVEAARKKLHPLCDFRFFLFSACISVGRVWLMLVKEIFLDTSLNTARHTGDKSRRGCGYKSKIGVLKMNDETQNQKPTWKLVQDKAYYIIQKDGSRARKTRNIDVTVGWNRESDNGTRPISHFADGVQSIEPDADGRVKLVLFPITYDRRNLTIHKLEWGASALHSKSSYRKLNSRKEPTMDNPVKPDC